MDTVSELEDDLHVYQFKSQIPGADSHCTFKVEMQPSAILCFKHWVASQCIQDTPRTPYMRINWTAGLIKRLYTYVDATVTSNHNQIVRYEISLSIIHSSQACTFIRQTNIATFFPQNLIEPLLIPVSECLGMGKSIRIYYMYLDSIPRMLINASTI